MFIKLVRVFAVHDNQFCYVMSHYEYKQSGKVQLYFFAYYTNLLTINRRLNRKLNFKYISCVIFVHRNVMTDTVIC